MVNVHEALRVRANVQLSMESIKETFEQVLFEHSKEGRELMANDDFKNPFRKVNSFMSRSGA